MDLGPEQASLYRAVGELYGPDPTPRQEDLLLMLQRLVAGHPRALLRSGSDLAKAVVESVGEEYLRSIPSAKSQRLVELALTLKAQGDRMLVFSFFAATVLPEVAIDLAQAGLRVATYTGGQSSAENEAAKAAFKDGSVDILLASDAGSTGLNLPEADYVVEFESATTFALRTQRFGRGLRIDSKKSHVFGVTLVARRTVEFGLLQSMMKRNRLQDLLLGDTGAEGHLDAGMRRDLFQTALREWYPLTWHTSSS